MITKFATSSSQLEDGKDGVIVPMKNEKCAEKIVMLLQNETIMFRISDNTYKKYYSNVQELNKFYRLIEN